MILRFHWQLHNALQSFVSSTRAVTTDGELQAFSVFCCRPAHDVPNPCPGQPLCQGRWSSWRWLCTSGPSSLLPALRGPKQLRISPDPFPLAPPSVPHQFHHIPPSLLLTIPSASDSSCCSGFPTHFFCEHFLSHHSSLSICPVTGFLPISLLHLPHLWFFSHSYAKSGHLMSHVFLFCILFLLSPHTFFFPLSGGDWMVGSGEMGLLFSRLCSVDWKMPLTPGRPCV